MADYKVTTDREIIKDWVENHEGMPSVIGEGKDMTVRIDFAGKDDERELSKMRKSQLVSWDEFFKVFEKNELAFVFYPKMHVDDPTLTYRFIKRENTDELATEGTKVRNFSDPDAFGTLPAHDSDERLNETERFGFDQDQDNETLQKAPSPEIESEQAVSGDMPDPASDDDSTSNARDFGLTLEDDPQAQEKN